MPSVFYQDVLFNRPQPPAYMNSANFHEYLRNPSMLHQINYQELKSLVLQYPYAPNLRYLMLAKSLLEGKREYDRNLVLASLSSIDRRKLRQLVSQFTLIAEKSETLTATEDFLELKDLSTLEDIMETEKRDNTAIAAVAIGGAALSGESIEFLDDLAEPSAENIGDTELSEVAPPAALEDLVIADVDSDTTSSENQPASADIEELTNIEDHPTTSEVEEVSKAIELEVPPLVTDTPSTNASQSDTVPLAQEGSNTLEEIGGEIEIEESAEGLFDTSLTEEQASGESANAISDNTVVGEEEPTTGPANETPPPVVAPSPSPKSAFNSYKRELQFKKPGILSGQIEKKEQTPYLPKAEEKTPPADAPIPPTPPLKGSYEPPANVAREVAAKSVSEDNTIATETLANILARQGHLDKAIKMFEKLSLQYPEKSDTFAAKIKELKNR